MDGSRRNMGIRRQKSSKQRKAIKFQPQTQHEMARPRFSIRLTSANTELQITIKERQTITENEIQSDERVLTNPKPHAKQSLNRAERGP